MQRKIAYEILLASFKDGQYANLGLKNRLKELKERMKKEKNQEK